MSTHIRTWGIAIIAIGVFAIPTLVTQAQTTPLVGKISQVSPQSTSIVVKTLHLKVTAYASVPEETSDHPFITATGDHVHDGIVATNLLPFGTKVMIPSLFGDKVFVVDDRMNKRMTNNIDIWMSTKEAAVVFGVHKANILVLGESTDTDLSLE